MTARTIYYRSVDFSGTNDCISTKSKIYLINV